MRWWERRRIARVTRDAAHVLANADNVAFGSVGIAGTVQPVTQAYRTAASAGAAGRESFISLINDASPAGRIYAATLLAGIEQDKGRSAWTALLSDARPVTVSTGCLVQSDTVAHYAQSQLAALDRRPFRQAPDSSC